jgi:hypothetical protein
MSTMTEQQVRDQLVGAWKLVSIVAIAPDGTTTNTLGEHPVGQISYSPGGQMSALLQHTDRPAMSGTTARDATDAEIVAAWRTFIGYFGPYTIDLEAGALVHHVAGAYLPSMVGTDQVRYFSFEDDRLILQPPATAAGHAKVTWQKVG